VLKDFSKFHPINKKEMSNKILILQKQKVEELILMKYFLILIWINWIINLKIIEIQMYSYLKDVLV